MSNGEVEITGILNQLAQSVIVLFLDAGILWHACMIMPESALENSEGTLGAGSDEYSRGKLPNAVVNRRAHQRMQKRQQSDRMGIPDTPTADGRIGF